MSSCVAPPEVSHDEEGEDEFDWEAAVKEIDVACQGASASKSRPDEDFANLHLQGNAYASISRPNPKKPAGTRQSTLDKFIGTVDRRSVAKNHSLSHQRAVVHDHIGGEDENTVCYTNIDLEAAKTWIYPVNIPLRDYQLSITKTALFSNTLVALPTGLGKTLIAAVVMYNYFRWFPEGKIVFTAPSRPLVMQQIEACHNIMGIPQEWTIDMTGQMSPSRRAPFWKVKRVFFVTPQVLEKDIQSGTCLVKHLVCLVIDEAHRALGNYSYCVAVRELMAVPVQLRILALTATPGSKQQTIQNVINNLNISTLEYRNESDQDVSPYVHNRKLELIEVAMGKDATEVNNLLLQAIQPFGARLCGFGVLHNRDLQTLSPCDLLNSRDKFRQAPPLNLPHMKYGEIEGYFGILITLYHIRKLLSSHGIRPAYEMLEEKLQQGSFARLMSRNEVIWKAKLLMQQSLSHGAPNPKLSKMIEILIDHFKVNNPKNSRVIIFSNFRGSVRDIMDSLMSIGEVVKATEFIGQSSGKALKGQTQKIQQAVLQKFRAGGYNVIVATSIGEEGLDIMEVDLVICFDANVSPLRMIQRMGRTGRKHDGRVVVLACEGSELKGYLRKQASSKVVRKHMRNGGRNSFDFHSSPRMIPHICKPEVQFVELSIEQFVPRERKVKDSPVHRPAFTRKVSDAETEIIDKYFHAVREDTWKPSLIAFPHFQAFPSSVHKVMHSFRTGLLIDTMQRLQGLSFYKDGANLLVEGKVSSSHCVGAETIALDARTERDDIIFHDSLKAHSQRKLSGSETLPTAVLNCKEEKSMPDFTSQIPPIHCFIFGTDFVSVNDLGLVSITSVPALPFLRKSQSCKNTSNSMDLLNSVKQNSCPAKTLPGVCAERSMQVNTIANVANRAEIGGINCDFVSRLYSPDTNEQMLHEVERIVLSTPSPNRDLINSVDCAVDTPAITIKKIPILLANEPASDFKDVEMSPRLTNMIEKGVVPESPIGEIGLYSSSNKHGAEHVKCGLLPNRSTDVQENNIPTENVSHSPELSNCEVRSETHSPLHVSPPKLCTGLQSKNLNSGNDNFKIYNSASGGGYASASINGEIRTPLINMNNDANARGFISDSPVHEEIHTPLFNLTNNCSKDWCLTSGEASKTIQEAPKFKRLRKYGEPGKGMLSKSLKENFSGPVSRSFTTVRHNPIKHAKGKHKRVTHVKNFIEEEAEVSSDTEVSDDEEEDKDNNSYDCSFIDDRINPTATSTQADANGNDMMAIYRRSLFTQSPMESQPNCSTDFSPDILPCRTRLDETGSCSSGKICHSLQTPHTGLKSTNVSTLRSSVSCPKDPERPSLVALPVETSGVPREVRNMESRKRKLSFNQVGYGPAASLQPQRLFQSPTGKASLQCESEDNELNGHVFYDDQFYEGLDLDALEAQATKLLRCKSELPLEGGQQINPNDSTEGNLELLNSPSFDLGI